MLYTKPSLYTMNRYNKIMKTCWCVCVCVCACACACARVRVCVCLCVFFLHVDIRVCDVVGDDIVLFSLLQITFIGNWFFSSMLPVNLRFKVDAVMSFNSHGRDQAKEDNPAPEDLMGLFPAHSSLPSCLASDSRFSGVSFAGVEVEDQRVWSDSLPLATSKENWSKPHLLAKVSSMCVIVM